MATVNQFVIRKSYSTERNLIGNENLAGKQWVRFPRRTQVLWYQGELFLITRKLSKVGTNGLLIEPYRGHWPKLTLVILNLMELF